MPLREKTLCLLVSFQETTMAMKMEAEAKKEGIPGRLIPLPTEISAGCGLSWKAPLHEKDRITAFLEKANIAYSGIYELML